MTGTPEFDNLSTRMAELSRELFSPKDIESQLQSVTDAAVALIPGADCADILMIAGRKRFTSHASTSTLPKELDSLQERFGEGPCVDAAADTLIVRSDDLRSERRWPKFADAAVAAGVLSVMSFQLFQYENNFGAVNLFGFVENAFDMESEVVGSVLATHAALALVAVRREREFKSALASRDVIGQAKGMIMERFGVDAVRAFDLLAKLSQDANTPLAAIAQRVIDQGPGDVKK